MVELALHVFDHNELSPTPVQVMVFPVRPKVQIPIQMVSQKPDAAFKRHEPRGEGQVVHFFRA